MKGLLVICAAAAALTLGTSAVAQDEVSVEVGVGDLDPSYEPHVAEMERRIAAAARRVCGTPESRSVTAIARVESCRANAIASARAR